MKKVFLCLQHDGNNVSLHSNSLKTKQTKKQQQQQQQQTRPTLNADRPSATLDP